MISASLVRDLREKTGVGMMDCKKALVETQGDFEKAVDWLRVKGLSAAAKKADRVTAEGLTALHIKDKSASIIELNSETDFVARNEQFQILVSNIASIAPNCKNLDELNNSLLPTGKKVSEEVSSSIAVIGENLSLRRVETISVQNGFIASYTHNHVATNMGKISVLVAIESDSINDKIESLGRQIAMHIAASKPLVLSVKDLDQSLIDRERAIFIEQTKESGKPDSVIEKMIEGRIRKFYQEVVLDEQMFIIDGKTRIADILHNISQEIGSEVKISGFVRFELGEGIENPNLTAEKIA